MRMNVRENEEIGAIHEKKKVYPQKLCKSYLIKIDRLLTF